MRPLGMNPSFNQLNARPVQPAQGEVKGVTTEQRFSGGIDLPSLGMLGVSGAAVAALATGVLAFGPIKARLALREYEKTMGDKPAQQQWEHLKALVQDTENHNLGIHKWAWEKLLDLPVEDGEKLRAVLDGLDFPDPLVVMTLERAARQANRNADIFENPKASELLGRLLDTYPHYQMESVSSSRYEGAPHPYKSMMTFGLNSGLSADSGESSVPHYVQSKPSAAYQKVRQEILRYQSETAVSE